MRPRNAITFFCCAMKAPGAPKSKSDGNRIALAPLSITSIALSAPSGGSDLLSNSTISIGWPSTPPAALMSSTASFAPAIVSASIGWNQPLKDMTRPNTGLSAACADGTAASPAIETAEKISPLVHVEAPFPLETTASGVSGIANAHGGPSRALPGHARAAARGRQNEMLISFGGSSRLKELRWLDADDISQPVARRRVQWPRRSISGEGVGGQAASALPDHV